MSLPNGETRFVQFGIKSRLIRINEWRAAGDPLEEFPKGNSLRRLTGASVFLCWLLAPDPICNRREVLFEPPGQIPMASAQSLEQLTLV